MANTDTNKPTPSNSGVPIVLKEYVKRMETLEEEKAEVAESIRDLKKEAKDNGVDPKGLVAAVKRKTETPEQKAKREKWEQMCDAYLFSDCYLPPGWSAERRAQQARQAAPWPSFRSDRPGSNRWRARWHGDQQRQ